MLGQALYFDGNDDYISVGEKSSCAALGLPVEAITISLSAPHNAAMLRILCARRTFVCFTHTRACACAPGLMSWCLARWVRADTFGPSHNAIISFAQDNGDEEGGWYIGSSSYNNQFIFALRAEEADSFSIITTSSMNLRTWYRERPPLCARVICGSRFGGEKNNHHRCVFCPRPAGIDATYDGADQRLSVDGALQVSSVSTSGKILYLDAFLTIGAGTHTMGHLPA